MGSAFSPSVISEEICLEFLRDSWRVLLFACRLLAKLVGPRASGLSPASPNCIQRQGWRPKRSRLGAVAHLESTSSPSSSSFHSPSHHRLVQTGPPDWRGLARSRSPSQRVNLSDRTRGRRFPCRQVKRVMDKRAGTKTTRHSFPPTVDADAGRRRAPERGAGNGAQAMLSPGCS